MTTLMEYDRVRWLRARTVAAAAGMSTAADSRDLPGPSLLAPAQVPASAFGNTGGGRFCHTTWQDVLDQVTAANGNLRRALEDDADRLNQVISCFQDRDHESADQLQAAAGAGTLSVFSAHLHSGGGEENDMVRAGQTRRLEETFSDNPGVLGADLNAEVTDGNRSADAILDFKDAGYEIDSGEVGGTTSDGRSIDYVITAPGVTPGGVTPGNPAGIPHGNPARVEGDPSDHDGQRVDLTVPRW